MVLEEIGCSKTSAAGRLKYDSHLAGSGRDCKLQVGNKWLYHGDAPGACSRPPGIEEASLVFERGARERRSSFTRRLTFGSPPLTHTHPAIILAQGGCW